MSVTRGAREEARERQKKDGSEGGESRAERRGERKSGGVLESEGWEGTWVDFRRLSRARMF